MGKERISPPIVCHHQLRKMSQTVIPIKRTTNFFSSFQYFIQDLYMLCISIPISQFLSFNPQRTEIKCKVLLNVNLDYDNIIVLFVGLQNPSITLTDSDFRKDS